MSTFRQIVCAVDFSPASHEAISKASFLAQLYQADLNLLHVIHVLPQTFGVTHPSDLATQDMMVQAEERARDLLRQAKQTHIPYAVKSRSFVRGGNWADEILVHLKESGADLLVVPGGESELQEPMDKLIDKVDIPILAFQPSTNGTGSRLGFRRVLLALGPNDHLEGMDQLLVRQMAQLDLEVLLLGVVNPKETQISMDQLRSQFETQALELQEQGVESVRFRVVIDEHPAGRIQEIANEANCDLIMMHTHSPDHLGDYKVSALTRGVMRTSGIPVMTRNPMQ